MRNTSLLILFLASIGLPASAASVAIVGSFGANVHTALTNGGHTTTSLSAMDVDDGDLLSGGYDVLLYGRSFFFANPSLAFLGEVDSFMDAGGGMVTEWDGAGILFSGFDSTYRFDDSYNQLGYISGSIGSGHFLATDTPIALTGASPVTQGVSDPLQAAGGTEFFYTSSGLDPAEVEVIATYTGNGSANFPAEDFGAILVGQQKNFVSLMFDAQDNALDPSLSRLFQNAVTFVDGRDLNSPTPVPLPAGLPLLLAGLFGLGGLKLRRNRFV